MIDVTNLTKSYGKLNVLNELSAHISQGSVCALAGPNACGKTTFIKILLGLVLPDGGEVSIGGSPISGRCDYRSLIGYMPQNAEFPPNLTGKEIFRLLQDIRTQTAPKLSALVELFGLDRHLNKPFSQLSGGTKQKIAAVAAFMFDAPILILDEPTVGLDPVAALHFKELVATSRKEGKTVILVSHIMSEVEQFATDMLFLLDGKVVFSGSVAHLIEQSGMPTLERGIVRMLNAANSHDLGKNPL